MNLQEVKGTAKDVQFKVATVEIADRDAAKLFAYRGTDIFLDIEPAQMSIDGVTGEVGE